MFTEHVTCVSFCLQFSTETFHILGRSQRDIIKRFHWFSCKVAVITVRF